MKKTFFALTVLLLTSGLAKAAEISSCADDVSKIETVYSNEDMVVKFATGAIAEAKFAAMSQKEEAPRANTFPEDYLARAVIVAKYGPEQACWKIQAPVTLDGKPAGVRQCYSYSCNIVSRSTF